VAEVVVVPLTPGSGGLAVCSGCGRKARVLDLGSLVVDFKLAKRLLDLGDALRRRVDRVLDVVSVLFLLTCSLPLAPLPKGLLVVGGQLVVTDRWLVRGEGGRAVAFSGVMQSGVVGTPLGRVEAREADGNVVLARRGNPFGKKRWDTAVTAGGSRLLDVALTGLRSSILGALGRSGGSRSRGFVVLGSSRRSGTGS
jgi:hypothetical protein